MGKPMNRKIVVLEEAANDIDSAFEFYEEIEFGLGSYFRSCLKDDLLDLGRYPGIHRIRFGFYQTRCSHFPYSIYYRDRSFNREIGAVLDQRMDPFSIKEKLSER